MRDSKQNRGNLQNEFIAAFLDKSFSFKKENKNNMSVQTLNHHDSNVLSRAVTSLARQRLSNPTRTDSPQIKTIVP